MALAGGTAPLVMTWLLSKFADSWVPVAVYMVLTELVSMVAVAFAVRVAAKEVCSANRG